MYDELKALYDERAKRPPQPDLLSMVAHGEAFNDIPKLEFIGQMVLLINGGNDTTRNSMSGGVWATHLFPDQLQKVREKPELVESMVSEIIRWHTPVIHMRRTATEDFELRGKTIRKGEKIAMWCISANRDEEVIERPNDFVVDRRRPREHISFGFGIHRCLGNRLAELQLRILWEEILKRDLRIEVMEKPVYQHSNLLHGIKSLPVRIN
jgi:cytochrome P450